MRAATCAGALAAAVWAASPAVAAGPAKATPREGAAGGTWRFHKVSVQDRPEMIGGEAFTFLAPVGWQVEGGLVWRTHPTMPAAVALRVRNPGGLEQLETFPTMGYSWGGMLGPGTFFPPGSIYLGNEVQPPVQDAIQYLKARLLPRARGGTGARIVGEQALPELARAVEESDPGWRGTGAVFSAGRVRIAYEVGGAPVEEDLYGVLTTLRLPGSGLSPGMVLQVADHLHGMRGAKGRIDEATKVMQTMVLSTRPNLQWFNRYVQLCQALTRIEMNRIHAAGELSRLISQNHAEVTDMMQRSYEERNASQDRIARKWSQVTRGVDEFHDPSSGRNVELPSGYGNAWVNNRGEYVVTDRAGFNPNVELDGNWTKLEPKP
jgi:hypothetical protein